ncbi:hypothetical protein CEXT_355541 [Caerostris extrusa]|uniref:Uncharacterized protein n=1 Tax=Caerostris extrusa TaxID=172846 RepID=A0AAV4RHN2_CAEEX|nr:hypothetical protein CEXT_355541 [Caerostris extrusa]
MHQSSRRAIAPKAGEEETGACQLFFYCRPDGYSSEPPFAPDPTIFAFKRFLNNNKNSETTPGSKRLDKVAFLIEFRELECLSWKIGK